MQGIDEECKEERKGVKKNNDKSYDLLLKGYEALCEDRGRSFLGRMHDSYNIE